MSFFTQGSPWFFLCDDWILLQGKLFFFADDRSFLFTGVTSLIFWLRKRIVSAAVAAEGALLNESAALFVVLFGGGVVVDVVDDAALAALLTLLLYFGLGFRYSEFFLIMLNIANKN